jgi:hypothetical protein
MKQQFTGSFIHIRLVEYCWVMSCSVLFKNLPYGRPLLCSSITFTRPLPNSLHHLRTCCTVITVAPHTVTSSQWISTGGTFSPIKTNDRTQFFFCQLFQYGRHLETTAVSVHVTWGGDYYCCLVVNIITNRTHACQLSAVILSAGIKQGTLLF